MADDRPNTEETTLRVSFKYLIVYSIYKILQKPKRLIKSYSQNRCLDARLLIRMRNSSQIYLN